MEAALEIAIKLKKALIRLEAIKQIPAWQAKAEARLNSQLQSLFSEVFRKTLKELSKLDTVPSNDMQRKRLADMLWEVENNFASIMNKEAVNAAGYGRNRVISELQKAGMRVSFSEFSEQVYRLIKEHVFEASERTLQRMVGDVMDSLAKSYEEGLGINDAAEALRDKFDSMKDYELRRIARTEIQGFQNEGAYLTEQELGVDYHMWWTAEDDRVRDEEDVSHVEMHGQIVKVGEPFSNGLRYPGDRAGDIREWINCRCRTVPFLMPEGYKAPTGRTWFYEDELVPVTEEAKEDKEFEESYSMSKEELEQYLGKEEAEKFINDLEESLKTHSEFIEELKTKNIDELIESSRNAAYQKIKENINRNVFTDEEYRIINDVINEWVIYPTRPEAMVMSDMLEKTGLTKGDTVSVIAKMFRTSNEDIINRYLSKGYTTLGNQDSIRKAIIKEYVKTQRLLKELGVEEIKLYRGIRTTDMDLNIQLNTSFEYFVRGTESWAANKKATEVFGDLILEKTFGRKEIFTSQLTQKYFCESEFLPLFNKSSFIVEVSKIENAGLIGAMKKQIKVYSDTSFEEYLAALTKLKKKLKRELTEEEMQKVAEEVRERLKEQEVT